MKAPYPIVVECFGIPGVGKTHVASRVCRFLEAEGISTNDLGIVIGKANSFNRIFQKTRLILRATANQPSALKIVFRMVKLHRPKKIRYWVKLIVNWLYVGAVISDRSQPSAVRVLDQGVGQAVWSTRFYGLEAPKQEVLVDALMELLETLPIAALLIVSIAAPDEVVLDRIRNRRGGRSALDKDEGSWERASEVTRATNRVLECLTCQSTRISLSVYTNHQSDGKDDGNLLNDTLGTWIASRVSHLV